MRLIASVSVDAAILFRQHPRDLDHHRIGQVIDAALGTVRGDVLQRERLAEDGRYLWVAPLLGGFRAAERQSFGADQRAGDDRRVRAERDQAGPAEWLLQAAGLRA